MYSRTTLVALTLTTLALLCYCTVTTTVTAPAPASTPNVTPADFSAAIKSRRTSWHPFGSSRCCCQPNHRASWPELQSHEVPCTGSRGQCTAQPVCCQNTSSKDIFVTGCTPSQLASESPHF
ncbi:hypothetical protein B0H34DRAFT_337465 [Crassisporium funariophilum]|nr:hypothetical protein B0H34DRAFT_282984 [Crassisporium funariophilum]KAF8163779.1 hypothetical protein B0H34DRAFT_337465 [Crassisporium funariophilum]